VRCTRRDGGKISPNVIPPIPPSGPRDVDGVQDKQFTGRDTLARCVAGHSRPPRLSHPSFVGLIRPESSVGGRALVSNDGRAFQLISLIVLLWYLLRYRLSKKFPLCLR